MEDLSLSGRYICFSLMKEKFAMPLLQVKEVIGNLKTTPLPQSPSHIKGLINLRGQVISIVDLGVKLKNAKSNSDEGKTIIILDFQEHFIGVIVDSVDSVVSFQDKDISTTAEMNLGINTDFITGVASDANGMTLLIDMKTIFSINDLKTSKVSKADRAA